MDRPTRYGAPDPEILDNTPIEMPLGSQRPTPLHVLIARMVRQAVEVEKQTEMETFEEADDFEEEDEATLDLSPYTLHEMQEEHWEDPFQEKPSEPETKAVSADTGDAPDPDALEPDEP